MKKLKTSLIVLSLIISASFATLLVACNNDNKNDDPNILTIGTTAQIEKAVYGEYNYDMLASGVAEMPLVSQTSDGRFEPLLAEFSSNNAKNWTFTIKDGMCWSDGVSVTAEDILYTLQYDDRNGSANFEDKTDSSGKTTQKKYESYLISQDKKSITLTLVTPNVRELTNMTSFRVMPKHIYHDKESVTNNEARITCGPYMLESFNKTANTLTFTKNPHFPVSAKWKKVIYKLFSNEDTMYLALKNGDLDTVWAYSSGVSKTYQDMLKNNGIVLEAMPATNAPAVLTFNNSKGLFADKNLRLAVLCALDYSAFKNYFGSPYSQDPNRGFVPTTTVGYKQTPKLVRDTQKASEYMTAAGYAKIGNYYNKNGTAAQFSLTVNASKTTHLGIAEFIKTQLEEFGIKVNLDVCDATAYNAKTSNKFSQNNVTMEAAVMGYTSAGMSMGEGLGSIYINGEHAVQGGAQVFDSELKSILNEMKNANILLDYQTSAAKLQDFYAESAPVIALYWDSLIVAHSSKLTNVTLDAVFGINNINNLFTATKRIG